MKHLLLFVGLTASLQAAGSAPTKTFIDYFKPIPAQAPLTSETWGAPGVLPRDVRNGLESVENKYCYWDGQILRGEDGKYHLYASRWDASSCASLRLLTLHSSFCILH